MIKIEISLASEKDREQLLDVFKHYNLREFVERRVSCYVSHNFTVVAKDEDRIIGRIQWHIKENPKAGVVEFEEVHVSEKYRCKGIGSSLIQYAIQSVIDYFRKIDVEPRKIFLFVGKDNKVARTFYEKHGFKLISEVGNLFSDTETELFYTLDL